MAYANKIVGECTEPGCKKTGDYVVKNSRNETMRECCRKHADALVRKLSAEEDAERERRG